jgi:hypothetical protein
MQSQDRTSLRWLVEYDALRRRVWILGQRCHHGATGSLLAAVACLGLIAERDNENPLLALIATGGVLMAHDWKDHSFWFQLGRGNQP